MPDIQSISPLITVAEIEPCLDFWTEALGFTVTATVPADPSLMGTDAAEGAPLGFAMLQSGEATIMLQTGASMDGDLPGLSDEVQPSTAMLFMKVEALEPYLPRLDGVDVVHERRTTFYGMDEIFVRGTCGTIVGLAAPMAEED